MKSNEIEVDVNESYIARVHDGQKVTAIECRGATEWLNARRTHFARPMAMHLGLGH